MADGFFLNHKRRFFRQVTFPSEPIFHGFTQATERNLRADLHDAVGDGEGVVEDAGIGEIAHAETVHPFHGAGMVLAAEVVFDADFACEHVLLI